MKRESHSPTPLHLLPPLTTGVRGIRVRSKVPPINHRIPQIFDKDRERCYKITSYLLGPDKAKRIGAFANEIVDFLI